MKDWDALLLGGRADRLTTGSGRTELEAYTYVPPGEGPFPVLYALDGRGTFLSTVSAVRTLAVITHGALADVAVVGVSRVLPDAAVEDFGGRMLDFSPSSPGPEGRGFLPPDLPLGGATEFLEAMTEDLMPAVEARIPVDPADRAVAGWSMSGLFAAWATVTRPELFRRAVLVSPSLWFDQEAVTRQVEHLPAGALAEHTVFACAGEHEGADWRGAFPQPPGDFEWPPETPDMQRVAQRFAAAAADRGARARYELMIGESHGTIWWAGITRGLVELYRTV